MRYSTFERRTRLRVSEFVLEARARSGDGAKPLVKSFGEVR